MTRTSERSGRRGRDPSRDASLRAHAAADAALQLPLPLFDPAPIAPPAPPRSPAGVRATMLCEQPVHYELRRSRRRTIGFVIDQRGLRVTAPRWVPLAEIERALQEKARWILRKLAEWRAHEARRERVAIRWRHGATLRYLGDTLVLSVEPCVRGVTRDGTLLRVGLPPHAGEDQLRDRVQAWLQARAREVFAERIPLFAQRLGRSPSRWALSSARTRWGSCTPDGAIRLNWRLVHFPLEIVDYVIAHEFAHLRELNHGPRFWATVGELFPDFERARARLREFTDDMPVG
ncbi:MAG TPA: SprT family zinc-dependent metalloprotease [Burkholderiaceae bacterium]|nr:SprT family zinc-dependent metalloprotease [Burkholderiaceae bacterium]